MRFLTSLACAAGLLLAQRAPTEAAWDLLAKGRRPEAIRLLHEIINTNPQNADARLLLGSVLMEDGDRAESIAQLTEAVRLRPRSAEAVNALGEAFKAFDDPKAARRQFEKAVALDPTFGAAQVNLGLVLVGAGDLAASAVPLDRAIRILGNKSDAALPHYLRAKVYTLQNAVDKAAAELKQAVSLRPDFAEAWSDLGEARKTLLDDAGALAAFERAVELSPDDAVAQYRLGAEYFHMAKVPQAIEHLRAAANLNPDDQSTLYSLQLALREDGQSEPARQVKEKLADLLRKRDKASETALTAIQINNQGAALEKAGNLPGALEKYRKALELNPDHVGIRTNFAAALLRTGRWEEGIAELREALRRDPSNTALQQALDTALDRGPRP
jgi:tetratricopeptide (TPR) repeat protein